MIVFKTFLKVLNKNRIPIIMYTVLLVVFGSLNFQTSDNSTNFVASKPNILIVNIDENIGITKNLIDYMTKNSNISNITGEDKINDALFYRDINYIIYIPDNYREDYLNNKKPIIEVKSTGDYQSSYAEMLLNRYIKIADVYNKEFTNEEELISKINNTLKLETTVEMTSKLDTNKLTKVTFYFNFANYSILAGSIFVICLILSSFKEEKVKKRTNISSMDIKKYNRILLLSNSLFVLCLWLFYAILSIVLLGSVMLTSHGLLYILNSFIFSICSLTIAFLIGNIVTNKNAVSGIVNVVALGSSFICGSFVPLEWLPSSVITLAHLLPSYWYIKSNELIKITEVLNMDTVSPIVFNMCILLVFSLILIVATNIVSRLKIKSN